MTIVILRHGLINVEMVVKNGGRLRRHHGPATLVASMTGQEVVDFVVGLSKLRAG